MRLRCALRCGAPPPRGRRCHSRYYNQQVVRVINHRKPPTTRSEGDWMKWVALDIPEVTQLSLEKFCDSRGFFCETFVRRERPDIDFLQDNLSPCGHSTWPALSGALRERSS